MQATDGVASRNEEKAKLTPIFPSGHLLPFILVTALFFLWGVPNNLNDVLIRQFMKSFAVSSFEAGLVQSAFYQGYFLLAMPAAILMRRLGYKAGFVISLLLLGFGTFLLVLAGRHCGPVWIFFVRVIRDRKRTFVPRNRVESIHCSTRRSCEF